MKHAIFLALGLLAAGCVDEATVKPFDLYDTTSTECIYYQPGHSDFVHRDRNGECEAHIWVEVES